MGRFAEAGSWTFEEDERLQRGHLEKKTDGEGNVREDAAVDVSHSGMEELAGDTTTSMSVRCILK